MLTADNRKAVPLDTTVRLVTPERVEFRYPLAGPFRRAISYLIDLLILGILIGIGLLITSLITMGSLAGVGLFFAYFFVLTWGYGGFCEGIFNGQTLGKKIIGIRVMTVEGVPITGTQAAIRNLIVAAEGPILFFLQVGPIPFLYFGGLASMVLTARFQSLGDLAAGTMVIIEEPRFDSKVQRVEPGIVEKILPLLPLRVSAGSEMARALSDYVRHRMRFGRDRREEIARHLANPLRERYGLPQQASSDAILCAFYHRLFLGD